MPYGGGGAEHRRDIEARADPGSADPTAFTETDQQIIKRIRARLRGEKE